MPDPATLKALESAALAVYRAAEVWDALLKRVRAGEVDNTKGPGAVEWDRVDRERAGTVAAFYDATIPHAQAPPEQRLEGLLATARAEERERCAEMLERWAAHRKEEWADGEMVGFAADILRANEEPPSEESAAPPTAPCGCAFDADTRAVARLCGIADAHINRMSERGVSDSEANAEAEALREHLLKALSLAFGEPADASA